MGGDFLVEKMSCHSKVVYYALPYSLKMSGTSMPDVGRRLFTSILYQTLVSIDGMVYWSI